MLRVLLFSCGDGIDKLFLELRPLVIALFSEAYGDGESTPFPVVMKYHCATLARQGRVARHFGNLCLGLTRYRHLWHLHLGDTDHCITGNQVGKFCFVQSLGTGWTFRQHQIADLGTAVPDPDFDLIIEFRAELH